MNCAPLRTPWCSSATRPLGWEQPAVATKGSAGVVGRAARGRPASEDTSSCARPLASRRREDLNLPRWTARCAAARDDREARGGNPADQRHHETSGGLGQLQLEDALFSVLCTLLHAALISTHGYCKRRRDCVSMTSPWGVRRGSRWSMQPSSAPKVLQLVGAVIPASDFTEIS